MPEGPSIRILKEAIEPFINKKVLKASGNATIEFKLLQNKNIKDIKNWGKHLLICFNGFFIRIHLMMFGSYSINEKKKSKPKLSLRFRNGELNFYACSVKLVEADPSAVYDWSIAVLSDEWNPSKALKSIKNMDDELVSDVLMNQEVFSGVGNIIKNEVLFRTYIHPKSIASSIPLKKQKELIKETVNYSFDFYKWKKEGVLKKHWLAYTKKTCPRCNIPLHKEYIGKGKRRTFFCNNCQELYK